MLDTSVRLLRLLSLLQTRRDWAGAELAERLGVTTRTVRNDVERLRLLGYEVRSARGVAGGYRLAPGAAVPPLLLDDEEAVAVGVGLAAAAAGSVAGLEETSVRALAKLRQLLPARLRHRVDTVAAATVSATGAGPSVDVDVLAAAAGAVRDHECLRFAYATRDGDPSRRLVEPHRLVYTGRRWYLLGWDRDRDDWRTFRLDRVRPSLPTGPRFAPRELPEDAATRVVRGVGQTQWRHHASVRLLAPLDVVGERVPPEAGLLTGLDDGSCRLETGSDSLDDLVGWLTRLDLDLVVEDPPELRDRLRVLAARYAAAAGSP
ncbi:YafY family protein [Nocardioides sp. SYSU D00038]|uniref:helix-turn-helix transcriptional regulator n=1 Tax=Nocardioides sp. SYSU D00038 TaxID=2812554 RepID=UPI001967A2A7|nr:transcriptional regulator [Nocardioides sp. SYSU D00038]